MAQLKSKSKTRELMLRAVAAFLGAKVLIAFAG
jgi:hypothetical protein